MSIPVVLWIVLGAVIAYVVVVLLIAYFVKNNIHVR
jgi:hypothetical protein